MKRNFNFFGFCWAVACCMLAVPNVKAANDFSVIFDKLTFDVMTVENSEIPSFQGKEITLPNMNFSVYIETLNVKPADPNRKIYMEVGFHYDIAKVSLRSDDSEDTAIPKNSELKGTIAPQQKLIQITHNVPVLTPILRTSTAGAKAPNIIYRSEESEDITVPLDVSGKSGPYSFTWPRLLSNENGSISRQPNIPLYIVSTDFPSSYEFEMTWPTQIFGPSLIWLDAAITGKETFSTINTYPVTDAVVVYIKENKYSDDGFSRNYQYVNLLKFRTKELRPDMAASIIGEYNWEDKGDLVAKIITALPATSIYKDGHDPRVVDDPAFGDYDSYQNTGKEVKLSMSTKGLEEGWYSRFILWRRGFKDTDGKIKGVRYVYDSNKADVYAIQDYVYVEASSDIAAISEDNNEAILYDVMGKKITTISETIFPKHLKGTYILKYKNGKIEKRVF